MNRLNISENLSLNISYKNLTEEINKSTNLTDEDINDIDGIDEEENIEEVKINETLERVTEVKIKKIIENV